MSIRTKISVGNFPVRKILRLSMSLRVFLLLLVLLAVALAQPTPEAEEGESRRKMKIEEIGREKRGCIRKEKESKRKKRKEEKRYKSKSGVLSSWANPNKNPLVALSSFPLSFPHTQTHKLTHTQTLSLSLPTAPVSGPSTELREFGRTVADSAFFRSLIFSLLFFVYIMGCNILSSLCLFEARLSLLSACCFSSRAILTR